MCAPGTAERSHPRSAVPPNTTTTTSTTGAKAVAIQVTRDLRSRGLPWRLVLRRAPTVIGEPRSPCARRIKATAFQQKGPHLPLCPARPAAVPPNTTTTTTTTGAKACGAARRRSGFSPSTKALPIPPLILTSLGDSARASRPFPARRLSRARGARSIGLPIPRAPRGDSLLVISHARAVATRLFARSPSSWPT